MTKKLHKKTIKKSLFSLLLSGLVCLFSGNIGFSQIIGEGDTSTFFLPIQTNFGYNYTQQIYSNDLIQPVAQDGNLVTSIGFYFTGTSSGQNPTNIQSFDSWTIYMSNTTKATFSNTSDWMPISEFQEVYSGVISFSGPETWVEITLDTPFEWDETKNLAIAVHETIPGFGGSSNWKAFETQGNTSIRYGSDSNVPNPSEPTFTAWSTNNINNQLKIVMVDDPLSNGSFSEIGLKAYPNPVKDYLMVSNNEKIDSITILNISGQVIFKKEINDLETQIDFSEFATGNYFIRVDSDKTNKLFKIVKH